MEAFKRTAQVKSARGERKAINTLKRKRDEQQRINSLFPYKMQKNRMRWGLLMGLEDKKKVKYFNGRSWDETKITVKSSKPRAAKEFPLP